MGIIITILSVVILVVLGLVVLVRDSKATQARLFLVICAGCVIWVITNQIANSTDFSLATINIANKIAFATGYLIILFGVLFSYFFPVKRRVPVYEKVLVAGLTLIGTIVSLLEPVVGLAIYQKDTIQFTSGEWIIVWILLFLVMLGILIRNLIRLPKEHSQVQRIQARLFMTAFVAAAVMALIMNVILPVLSLNWGTTVYGPLSTVVLVGLLTYTIIRHRLFDIRLAVVRTSAYLASLVTIAILYAVAGYAIAHAIFRTEHLSTSYSIALALLLAMVFQPVLSFFKQTTNKIFYKGIFRAEEFYARLNKVLSSTIQLRELLIRASEEIAYALKSERVFFFLYQAHSSSLSIGNKAHLKPSNADMAIIDAYLKENVGRSIIEADDLPPKDPIRRMLVGYRVILAIPLIQQKTTVGYLFLGQKHAAGSYSRQDIRVLETIADELAIAIQNAASVQEVRSLNANLQQRIDNATEELRKSNEQLRDLDVAKDEFVSMASHQLRTPLTSVKGYLSMVLDGDAGKITKAQRQLLSEAFTSSERMVHLINDFLNVSRIQTGKFLIDRKEVDLGKVVAQEVKALETTAESRQLKLKVVVPPKPVLISIDEGKIRQVIMNFIDNALFYSKPKQEITVFLSVTPREAKLEVRDHGIGVPQHQQTQLFTKFFRADNARLQRPDGTGVGLYLAKKVIDGHGGKLVFSSVEGKGSTFGFKLPLK